MPESTRRTFVKIAGTAVASAVTLAPGSAAPVIDHYVPSDKKLDPRWVKALFAKGTRKPYRGRRLETIGMPCGGVCAGQLYVRGDGTLAHWWIANNAYNTGYGIYDQVATPLGTYPQVYTTFRPVSPIEQGFAIRVKGESGEPQVRRLSRDDFDDIRFLGEYPIATIDYATKDKPPLPVTVRAEVFSPFIPLNARDSAIPATVLRYTVKNDSKAPLDVSIAGWLQNAVFADLWGRVAAECRNTVVRKGGLTSVRMDVVKAAAGVRPRRRVTVFEDFESGSYENWTIEGAAFGEGPVSQGLEGQEVSGWEGKYFATSFHGGEGPTGRLISKPFRITERYIACRIGAGRYPDETSLSVVIDGKVVRAVTGTQHDPLVARYCDVSEFIGRRAHLEIADRRSGIRGHVNVDQIYFTNLPPLDDVPFSEDHAQFGDMALTALDGDAAATAVWKSREAFLEEFAGSGARGGPDQATHPVGEKRCGAVASSLRLEAGESKQLTFLLTWRFPNRHQGTRGSGWGQPADTGEWVGNMYNNWFGDSLEVASYVAGNWDRLVGDTFLFRNTYFDTTLPYWFARRIAMPLANLATETCQWRANGRFWAWEGVGSCFGTCTHVWNYAQGAGRVFPELERSVREMQDFGEALDTETGAVGHRGADTRPVLDGQSGTILKAFREHLTSPDEEFLKRNWPKVELALKWLISQDGNADGLIEGQQANTYDIAFFGANTYVGSLYLAALRAGETMARHMGDVKFARRLRAIFESGSRLSVERLWNGEYFIQDVDLSEHPKNQYADGCLADQLFGQSWADQLKLGYLYPRQHVRAALESIWEYNWAPDVASQNKVHRPERYYARPGEAGLFICTWPKSKHLGENGVLYRNEVWTGIEYQVAGHMLYQGMVTEALAIVRALEERYDGAKHNPWNEIECGDHYARSLASWGCLLGACGFHYDGPAGAIGFAPRLTPEDFKAFFTAAEGWGSLSQQRDGNRQVNRFEVKWGSLRVAKIVLEAPEGVKVRRVAASVGERQAGLRMSQAGSRVVVNLVEPTIARRGESLEVRLDWGDQ